MIRRRGVIAASGYLVVTLAIGSALWLQQPLSLGPGVETGPTALSARLLALVMGALLGNWLVFAIVEPVMPESTDR
ncbi:MAG: hypothetical protein SVG88_04420 [Halobacteriales archaeon]|nr:hypothetical protein [Halobacteriales archaeon]